MKKLLLLIGLVFFLTPSLASAEKPKYNYCKKENERPYASAFDCFPDLTISEEEFLNATSRIFCQKSNGDVYTISSNSGNDCKKDEVISEDQYAKVNIKKSDEKRDKQREKTFRKMEREIKKRYGVNYETYIKHKKISEKNRGKYKAAKEWAAQYKGGQGSLDGKQASANQQSTNQEKGKSFDEKWGDTPKKHQSGYQRWVGKQGSKGKYPW